MTTTLATDLMLSARSLDVAEPRLLVFGPVARGNPYQELIYGDLRSAGIAPVPCLPWEQRSAVLGALAAGIPTGFHLHWTTVVTAHADDAAHAERLTVDFLDEIDTWKAAGLRFVWTVHNRMPHRTRFPAVERSFRAALAQRADLIHVMTTEATKITAGLYELPGDRIVVVPHPSYTGAYPTYFRRDDCRLRMGIETRDLVVAAVGAVEAYKNIPMLYEAVRVARSRTGRRIWLIVAGAHDPSVDPVLDDLITELRADPYALVEARRLSDREMSEFVTAADVVASCYDTPLVSGSAMLAATIGRPVLAIDTPQSRSVLGEAGFFARVGDADSIAATLAELDPDALARAGDAARALAASVAPTTISREITRMLDEALSPSSGARARP